VNIYYLARQLRKTRYLIVYYVIHRQSNTTTTDVNSACNGCLTLNIDTYVPMDPSRMLTSRYCIFGATPDHRQALVLIRYVAC